MSFSLLADVEVRKITELEPQWFSTRDIRLVLLDFDNTIVPYTTSEPSEEFVRWKAALEQAGIYPPISVLPSLSRLMKDGIGEGFTRADHPSLSNQLFAAYSKVKDARSLASVIGEDELSDTDKRYLEFGKAFEQYFVQQSDQEDRSLEQTLELAREKGADRVLVLDGDGERLVEV